MLERQGEEQKIICVEVVRIYVNAYDLMEDVAIGREVWRNKIHVAGPKLLG